MTDYAKLDASRAWHYKADRLEDAKAAGCQYITEHAVQCYKLGGGVNGGAKLFGFRANPFRKLLHMIGTEMQGPGGNHGDGLTADLVVSLRLGWEGGRGKRAYVREFDRKHGLNMSHRALESALDRRTWRGV